MKNYPSRAAKYALFLIILLLILILVMQWTGYTTLPLNALITGTRGLLLLGVVAGFSLLYPFFGFVEKRLLFDATQRTEEVERVMAMCGYRRAEGDTPEHMLFESISAVKRNILFHQGPVVIVTRDGKSFIEGPRKDVVRAYYRMGTYIV